MKYLKNIVTILSDMLITLSVIIFLYIIYLYYWSNYSVKEDLNTIYNNASNVAYNTETTYTDKNIIGILTIPLLDNLSSPILEGTSMQILNKGVIGHYTNTGKPDDKSNNNFALAAHRTGFGHPFLNIDRLKIDDEVIVQYNRVKYIYKLIYQIPKLDPYKIDILTHVESYLPKAMRDKDNKYITLMSCTPKYSTSYRLVWIGILEKDENNNN